MPLWLSATCTDRPAASGPPPPRRPEVRLALMTDIMGQLEPCGCQSRPLGGIDKAAAVISELGADGTPVHALLAGPLWFGAMAHGPEAGELKTQEIWQAETLTAALGTLPVAAAALGRRDLKHGPEILSRLGERAEFAILAGPRVGAERGQGDGQRWRETTVVETSQLRIGVWGLCAPEAGDQARRRQTVERAARYTRKLRSQGVDAVVGLFSGPRRWTRQIASAAQGLDFLLQGGLDRGRVLPPREVGDTTLLHAGHRGQGVLIVELFTGRGERWQDDSAWSRDVVYGGYAKRIEQLRLRLADWEQDPSVDPSAVQAQRQRLKRLKHEARASVVRPPASARRFRARFIELDDTMASEAETAALLNQHDKRLNAHNRKVFADQRPAPPEPGEPRYVGSKACADCHAPAYEWWQNTPHGRAYATLQKRDKQFHLSCVGCHVTGYQQPGGSTVTHHEGLENVGCESCHGPGSAHVADPGQDPATVRREVPERLCVTCHNPEHSDRFHYPTYRAMLLVPGHGKSL